MYTAFSNVSQSTQERGVATPVQFATKVTFLFCFKESKAVQQLSFWNNFRSTLMSLVTQKRIFRRFCSAFACICLDLRDPQTKLISIFRFTFKIFLKEISTHSSSVTSWGFNLIHLICFSLKDFLGPLNILGLWKVTISILVSEAAW